mmetsp:Transcript_6327/g.9552  ORF Transcript_6327/g.9552 Transcript_6327/m.9552 type:complete len:90 (+) Transcript_6327:316-585(+)
MVSIPADMISIIIIELSCHQRSTILVSNRILMKQSSKYLELPLKDDIWLIGHTSLEYLADSIVSSLYYFNLITSIEISLVIDVNMTTSL